MPPNFHPIVASLLRNRTGAVLVSLQIAIALAVLVNAVYVIKQRVDRINRPTGIDDANLFTIETSGFTDRYDYGSSVREDLAYLRGLDGVVAATPSSSIPLSGSGVGTTLYTAADMRTGSQDALMYEMDQSGIQTLGGHLLAGRAFRADEILPPLTANDQSSRVSQIIVTQALAQALFPTGDALGKTLYDETGRPVTLIGIVANMQGAWPKADFAEKVVFEPQQPMLYGFLYLVRTQPGRRDELMRITGEHLAASNPDRVIDSVASVEHYKRLSYMTDRITAILLVAVTGALLAITALGIFGLATFNVTTRARQIGTRRALGASKRDIVQHFMVENALVTSAGIIAGCVLALGAGYWLSLQYKLPRLDLYYLVAGVLFLWLLGQAAAWQPARRAAAVPPSVATRAS